MVIVAALFVEAAGAGVGEKMLLSRERELRFDCGRLSVGSRESPMLQCSCVGGDACGWIWRSVPTITCANEDSGARWSCSCPNKNVRIVPLAVSCEGYFHRRDPYKIPGSCGLTLRAEFVRKRISLAQTPAMRFDCESWQCLCKGEICNTVGVVDCYNSGSTDNREQWRCSSASAHIIDAHIECDGFEGPDDVYKQNGSCRVHFSALPAVPSFLLNHEKRLVFHCDRSISSSKGITNPQCLCNGSTCERSMKKVVCDRKDTDFVCYASGKLISRYIISCEGLLHADDPRKIKGSCSIHMQHQPPINHHSAELTLFFAISFLFWITLCASIAPPRG